MRLASISITNMAGFEQFETKLPAVAIIQGKNGHGKTSFLDCFKFAFGRGHDEDIIHGDAPEGEILIEFDNGAALKCRASRVRNETVRSWRAPGAKRFVVSREQIDAIANAVSYDPLAFMEKDEKEQMSIMLRVLPIECSDEEIAEAVGDALVALPPHPGNALDRINALHKQIYNLRHDYNVGADAQEKHAGELQKTLQPPAPEGKDWSSEVARIQAEKATAEQAQADEITKIGNTLQQVKEASVRLEQSEKGAVDRDIDAQIKALEAERVKRKKQIEEDAAFEVATARDTANANARNVNALYGPQIQGFVAELATAQERATRAAQSDGTRLSIDAATTEAAAKRAEAAKCTAALERLDKLKATVAGRLKGYTILDGRIVREENGKFVPFKRWNTEAQMRFSLRIGVQAHGEAGFLCIDNAEHFDSEHRLALVNTAEKYSQTEGLQFLIASVSDQPFSITEAGAQNGAH
jgi:hypothetical protein